MRRTLLIAVLLAAVYAATLGSTDPWDLGIGLALGLAVLALERRWTGPLRPYPRRALPLRPVATLAFAGAVLADVARGTWRVGLVAAGLRPLRSPGLVEVPIGERTPRGIAVTGLAAGLSPGTVLLDVDEERGLMLFHAFDASDPARVRDGLDRLYTRWQRPVVP